MTLRRLSALTICASLLAGAAWAEGHLSVDAAFLRAAPPNAPVLGGYAVITNAGQEDDTLIAAVTEAAGRVELHEMILEDDVMRMREVAGGIPVPAGGTVVLRPGGLHLMLMAPTGAAAVGETRDVTLTFASGAEMTVPFAVAQVPEIELGLAAAGGGAHGGAMGHESDG